MRYFYVNIIYKGYQEWMGSWYLEILRLELLGADVDF